MVVFAFAIIDKPISALDSSRDANIVERPQWLMAPRAQRPDDVA